MRLKKILWFITAGIVVSLLSVVIPVSPVHAVNGTASILQASGPVGSSITAIGSGFSAGTNFVIYFDTTQVYPGVIAAGGLFSVSFLVPPKPRFTYTVRLTATNADATSFDGPIGTFSVTPKVSLNASSSYVGDQISISGDGFVSSSPITIYFDSDALSTTTTATADGTLSSFAFTVPASARGNHTIKARDSMGDSPGATFNVNNKIALSSSSGAVADKITVTGTGFAASSAISFYWDEVQSAGSVTTDPKGSFTFPNFTVPATSRGAHTIKASDESANSATASFTVAQKMTMTPTTGFPNTAVSVSGSGFEASRALTITYNNAPVVTNPPSVSTDANGSFTASFTVPAGVAGTYTVQVSDGTYSSTASFTAVVEAKISHTTTAQNPGTVGMQLTITGSGFKPNTVVIVSYSSTSVELARTTTDTVGSFSVTVTIPASAGGDHIITATDGTTLKNFPFYMEKTPPLIPELVAPITTAKGKPPKVKNITLFDWKDVTDPSAPLTYSMEIAIDKDFTKVGLRKTNLTKSEYMLIEKEKLPSNKSNTPYYWRVKAIDGASNESAWSAGQAFNVGFSFEFTGWMLYVAIGLGGIILLAIGFFLGRSSATAY